MTLHEQLDQMQKLAALVEGVGAIAARAAEFAAALDLVKAAKAAGEITVTDHFIGGKSTHSVTISFPSEQASAFFFKAVSHMRSPAPAVADVLDGSEGWTAAAGSWVADFFKHQG